MNRPHAYHPQCGCSACGDDDLADERRDEAIAAVVPAIAKRLVGSEDFACGVLVDLPPETQRSVLQDVGRFFEDFHNAPDKVDALAALAVRLYRDLLPQIEHAAQEQARDDAAAEYDRAVAA